MGNRLAGMQRTVRTNVRLFDSIMCLRPVAVHRTKLYGFFLAHLVEYLFARSFVMERVE